MQQLRNSKLPLYLQTRQYLLSLIEEGTYEPGEQLPSEAHLAAQLGISRPTLREALQYLEQEGIVIRRHGVGTFIAPGSLLQFDSGLERLESVLELAGRQGLQVQCQDLQVEEVPADAQAAGRLQIRVGTPLTVVRRAIAVRKRPVAYMVDTVSADVLSPEDVGEAFNGSVLDLLRYREAGQVVQAVADLVALNADDVLSQKLRIQVGRALLLIEECLFDQEGRVIGFSHNYFVPDFFRFHVVRR